MRRLHDSQPFATACLHAFNVIKDTHELACRIVQFWSTSQKQPTASLQVAETIRGAKNLSPKAQRQGAVMPAVLLSPLVKWSLAALGGAMVVHWVVKEARRINEELDNARRVKVPIIAAMTGHLMAGGMLMSAAENWAISRGYNELGSDTEANNGLSIQAHARLGFEEVERLVCFLKQI